MCVHTYIHVYMHTYVRIAHICTSDTRNLFDRHDEYVALRTDAKQISASKLERFTVSRSSTLSPPAYAIADILRIQIYLYDSVMRMCREKERKKERGKQNFAYRDLRM